MHSRQEVQDVLDGRSDKLSKFERLSTGFENLAQDLQKNRNQTHLCRRRTRLAVVCGPCSINNVDSALEYAKLLAAAKQKHKEDLAIVMRVYFEKPRTSVGWKGLINDPFLDGTFKINTGLRLGRKYVFNAH